MVNKLSQTIIDFNKMDKKNIKTIKIGDKIIGPDENGQVILNGTSGGTGGNTGGDTDPDHPAAGADYYAGSLADGEITERYLLYQRDESVAEQTGSQTVTLLRDVGSTFNMAGDGATFLIHLQRTEMTKGAKGAVTDIELNYDTNNVAKDGYFTTTSPYPVYTKSADLATKKTLAVPINGIGENLSGKNVKAPQLNISFNGDGTMTFESVTGYDNDGSSAGATGANYDVVVDVIATFSVQPAVAQIPQSINFFTGSGSGEIALAGASDFLENSMDGIEITFDDYFLNTIGSTRIYPSTVLTKTVIRIPKNQLINGFKFGLNNILKSVGTKFSYETANNPGNWTTSAANNTYLSTPLDAYIEIDIASINSPMKLRNSYTAGSEPHNNSFYIPTIKKVTTYKN